jgi:hypothetical protein
MKKAPLGQGSLMFNDIYSPILALRVRALADFKRFLTLGLTKYSPLRMSASSPSLMHFRLKVLKALSNESLLSTVTFVLSPPILGNESN